MSDPSIYEGVEIVPMVAGIVVVLCIAVLIVTEWAWPRWYWARHGRLPPGYRVEEPERKGHE